MKKLFTILLLILFIGATYAQEYPKREMRAAWVATVANIDWPTSRNITPGEQVTEMTEMFESLKEAGMNAIFFQVRTECDALYDSPYEPWSYWLTGEQGKAPEPYYDPLAFAVREAHRLGMELHAWFNPYRAVKDTGGYKLAENHVAAEHPDWILDFGTYKMLDPGLPQVREHILKIMTDVLHRYDVDGIHFDDYFYPYGPKVSNEDSVTFLNYSRGFTNVDDWRRDNINRLMAEIYDIVKAVKPDVKFGISPFGIVQNKYTGTDGFDAYNILYCDPLTWLEEKAVDYINPQLYWKIGHEKADYKKLQPWWPTVLNGRHLYVGHYSSKMAPEDFEPRSELGDQLRLNRITENVHGSVYFSAKSITRNWGGLKDSMQNDWFKYPALPPVMEWKDELPPLDPVNAQVQEDSVNITVSWEAPGAAPKDGDKPYYYIIYKFGEDAEYDLSDPKNIAGFAYEGKTSYTEPVKDNDGKNYKYVVTSVDRLQNESKGITAK